MCARVPGRVPREYGRVFHHLGVPPAFVCALVGCWGAVAVIVGAAAAGGEEYDFVMLRKLVCDYPACHAGCAGAIVVICRLTLWPWTHDITF